MPRPRDIVPASNSSRTEAGKRFRRWGAALVAVVVLVTMGTVGAGHLGIVPSAKPVPYLTIDTSRGLHVDVRLEVADDAVSRERGLMYRRSLADDAGMLFVFPEDSQIGFWMKNTYIPLSIAFISFDGRIVDVQDMQPQTETNHVPRALYRYALEVNQGFFSRHGIEVGDTVELHLK